MSADWSQIGRVKVRNDEYRVKCWQSDIKQEIRKSKKIKVIKRKNREENRKTWSSSFLSKAIAATAENKKNHLWSKGNDNRGISQNWDFLLSSSGRDFIS